jgi:hypothetical protein
LPSVEPAAKPGLTPLLSDAVLRTVVSAAIQDLADFLMNFGDQRTRFRARRW